MGQVPRYGIVGDGRMARHFRHYLGMLGVPARQWSRRTEGRAGIVPERQLADCEVVLVLIRDGAIVSFLEERRSLFAGRRAVHFSGAVATPLAAGFHPLMTFGEELYDLGTYRDIPFIGERGGPGFTEIFPELSNPAYAIDREDKALYHGLCAMGGNFTVLLWQKLFSDFERRLGLPREAAYPYLRRIAANLEADADRALTGPLQRKDAATIRSHLGALGGDPYAEVYRSFVNAVSPEVLQ